MVALLIQLLLAIRSWFARRARLETENLILRQQLVVLRRKSPKRVRLWNIDRLLLVWSYRLYPSLLDAIIIVQPETVIRWHRRGFRAYWRWKSRHLGGRPRTAAEIRALIRRMSRENPLWGAPRIHGELLMLGIEVAESTVGRYMVRRRRPPSQGWKTFLRNHAAAIASIDLFVVRTISFKLLYGLVILRHARRRLLSISVTNNPTAEWIAGQVTDAFPWDEAPRHLIRQIHREEVDLALLTRDHRERFAEVDLCVSGVVAQWHEHLAQPLAALVHVAPYDRDPAAVPVLIAEPLEDPLSGVVLLGRVTLILLQDPVDDPEQWIQLGPRRRPAPPISWRHRERQHLRHRPRVDPKASRRFPLTDSLYINCSSYLCVQFHPLHPSAHLCRAPANGLLLPDFYSDATGLSGCFSEGFSLRCSQDSTRSSLLPPRLGIATRRSRVGR